MNTEIFDELPRGFCDCDDGRYARNILSEHPIFAFAMLNYLRIPGAIPRNQDVIYTKGDGFLYLSYDFTFFVPTIEEELSVSREFNIGQLTSWPQIIVPPEFSQMINSAANIYPWDRSHEADEERESHVHRECGPIKLVNQVALVIELGIEPDGSGMNIMKQIIEPGAPGYFPPNEMDANIQEGTGLCGRYVPAGAFLNNNQQSGNGYD